MRNVMSDARARRAIRCICMLAPVLVALLVGSPAHSAGEQRLALVIGNAAYKRQPLANPVNDAGAVANKLRGLGFSVTYEHDLDARRMRRAIRTFGERLQATGGVGLFYFSGHGLQAGGRNYLIPVDADIEHEYEIADEGLNAERVIGAMMAANNRLNIVILDACRNNPYERGFRSNEQGLAPMQADTPGATGLLIAYATAPGTVASDGGDGNSPYTKALIAEMDTPGVDINEMFIRVRGRVLSATNDNQRPWESSSLIETFAFNRAQEAIQAKPDAAIEIDEDTDASQGNGGDPSLELAFWNTIKDSSDSADYKAYLQQYPQGTFTELARIRLAKQENAQTTASQSREIAERTSLTIRSNVSGDMVYLNDERMRPTGPKPFALPSGRHQVRVAKAGYVTHSQTIDLRKGEQRTVRITLQPIENTNTPPPRAPTTVPERVTPEVVPNVPVVQKENITSQTPEPVLVQPRSEAPTPTRLAEREFTFPGQTRSRQRVGSFCCGGEVATIRDEGGRALGQIHFYEQRRWLTNSRGTYAKTIVIRVLGIANLSQPEAQLVEQQVLFRGYEMKRGQATLASKTVRAGVLSYTVDITGASVENYLGERHILKGSLKAKISVSLTQ